MRGPRTLSLLAVAIATLAIASATARAADPPARLSTDPYAGSSFHATEVEPDSFSFGSTIVSAFQVGRFFDGGAINAGWATSTDNGQTWKNGFLSGLTNGSGVFAGVTRVSDTSVAYDDNSKTWLIASLALDAGQRGVAIAVSRSTDGGQTWGPPVSVATAGGTSDFDKGWIVCDNTTTSAYYGHCYAQWDDVGATANDTIKMSTSTDGGGTWSAATNTVGSAQGLGGQPVVQPDGTVVVPVANADETKIEAFRSTNGGATWSNPALTEVATVAHHPVGGPIRAGPLPSAEIDGAGKVYVAWEDCGFRVGCPANDIVYSSSADGVAWSAPARVPIDATTSGVDHFVPGLAVDPATSGAGAHLSLAYHYLPDASCSGADACRLDVGLISSVDGGAHWGAPQQLAGPITVSWLVPTSQGYMFGDYISASFTGDGVARALFASACAPTGGVYDEAIYAASAASVPLACPGPPDNKPPDNKPPAAHAISKLKIAPSRFRAGRRGPSIARALGTIVSYTASAAGTTTFTVKRAVVRHGRRGWKRMPGSFQRSDLAGANRFRFSGHVRGRLRQGLYLMEADPGGTAGKSRRARFRVLRPARTAAAR